MSPGEAYANWRLPIRLEERPTSSLRVPFSEIELQARWFSGHFPSVLQTSDGEKVEIIHRGVWNREPGPDFCEAVVQIGDQPPKRGNIELDTNLGDWENHGHATNSAFDNVVLHLFVENTQARFFTRTSKNRMVPQVRLDLLNTDVLPAHPPLAILGKCSAPLADLADDVRTNLIESAAHYRIQKKAGSFQRLSKACGWDEALFQSLAVTLGYKENKLPFLLLAQRIGLKNLFAESANIDALLFGCAGFLDATSLREFAQETQEYLRSLWERWWVIRLQWQRFVLPRSAWKLTGARPANHPQRRLAALGLIVKNWKEIREAFRQSSLLELEKTLGSLEHTYWSEHYTISSQRAKTPIALLGKTRIVEMLVNVAIPCAMSDAPDHWKKLAQIKQPLENRKLKTGILRLFGADEKHANKSVLHQQGIIQIYEDFCLRDLTDCSRCPFPEKVLHWEKC